MSNVTSTTPHGQTKNTSSPVKSNGSGRQKFRIPRRILTAIISTAGAIVVALVYTLVPLHIVPASSTFSSSTSQNSTPPAGFTVTSKCPDPNRVAQLMGLSPNSVQTNGEPCGFIWGNNGGFTSQAHCPNAGILGPTSIELTPTKQPPDAEVLECSGSDSATLPSLYGMTIRFVKFNPESDACTILGKHSQDHHDNVVGPKKCFTVTSLEDGQVIQDKNVPLTITGTYSKGSGPVWVLLQDSFGSYYLQNPPLQFQTGYEWVAQNIRPEKGITMIDFVQVGSDGNDFFQQEVAAKKYAAFSTLPADSTTLLTLHITSQVSG